MAIEGVVFDFGGVMTTSTMPDRVRPIVRRLGIDWQILVDGFNRYRRQMDGDEMTIDEMYARIWSDAGIAVDPESAAKIIEADQASFLSRNERTRRWMHNLKQRGFKIGILTNMCSAFARRFRAEFPDFIALADAMVVSGEVRMYKPQPGIYRLLRERIGLKAETLCFIDDVEENCAGARLDGWQAIRFAGNEDCEVRFEQLLNA